MKKPCELLYEELCQVDPETAKKVSSNDLRRIIRALEVFESTGIPISKYQKCFTQISGDYRPIFIGILWEREVLYRRINARVEEMLARGLLEETKRLLNLPHPLSHTAAQAIGYKEAIAATQDPTQLPQLLPTIQRNTRVFAKRQMTWLRRFPVHWLAPDMTGDIPKLAQPVVQYWNEAKPQL
jgi:tRNA dimethylallyltransferase